MRTLYVNANIEFTGKVMDFIESELSRRNFPAQLRPGILTAVEEIFVNIAMYAYKPENKGNVAISVTVDKKAVIQFADSGKPFNPIENSVPDLDRPIVERKIGGLGIHFVKNMMDEIEYVHSDGKNILTITKDTDKVN